MTSHQEKGMSVKTARRLGLQMSDHERRNAVFAGSVAWLVAAVLDGWRTPPDLAGRRSRYVVPHSLPWWPARQVRRERRLRALVDGYAARDREAREALRQITESVC